MRFTVGDIQHFKFNRRLEHAYGRVNRIPNIGKISSPYALTREFNFFVIQESPCPLVRHHARSIVLAVYVEVPEADDTHAEIVMIRVGKQFDCFLRDSVRGKRSVGHIIFLPRNIRIVSIH